MSFSILYMHDFVIILSFIVWCCTPSNALRYGIARACFQFSCLWLFLFYSSSCSKYNRKLTSFSICESCCICFHTGSLWMVAMADLVLFHFGWAMAGLPVQAAELVALTCLEKTNLLNILLCVTTDNLLIRISNHHSD